MGCFSLTPLIKGRILRHSDGKRRSGSLSPIGWWAIGMLAALALACSPQATDEEIEQMCRRLVELRKKESDQAMKESCIAEAKAEKISQRQARCRASAVNALEYWNRCRTGAARPR